jgi:maleamate amidohydrolase
MIRRAFSVLSLTLLSACLATTGKPIERYERPRSALLLVDLQEDFLSEAGRMSVAREQVEPMLHAIEELAAQAQARELPVAHVRNVFSRGDIANWFRNHAAVDGEPGTKLDPRTAALSATVFDKSAPDSFSNEGLDTFLRDRQVDHLVLTGVFADGCVYWTARGALNRGYRVTVVRHAVADSNDENRTDALENLAERGVRVVDSLDDVAW